MADADKLFDLADGIVGQATPNEQIEVLVSSAVETEVRAYEGSVESFVSAESQGVGIRVISDHRQGFACVGSLDPAAVAEALAEARDNAAFGSPDEHLHLVEPDGVAVPDLDLDRAALQATTPEEKIEIALELEAAVRRGHELIVGIESVDYGDSYGVSVVASTTGIRTASSEGACSIAAFSLAQQADDVTTGFGFSVGREPLDLDIESTAAAAVSRAITMLGATSIPSERLTVVFDPWVTAQFIAIVADAFSADAVIKGRSFAAGRVGEQLGSSAVNLLEDPTDQRWFGAVASDGEGLATRPVALLTGGVVEGFLMDGYTASVLGRSSSGSAVRGGFGSTPSPGAQSVFLKAGPLGPDEIIGSINNGLYVTEVTGLHSGVNPVSGDFSTGVEAQRIVNGELGAPVREVTIASTLQRMLSDIIDVGSDLTAMPLEASGQTISIADVTLSGS